METFHFPQVSGLKKFSSQQERYFFFSFISSKHQPAVKKSFHLGLKNVRPLWYLPQFIHVLNENLGHITQHRGKITHSPPTIFQQKSGSERLSKKRNSAEDMQRAKLCGKERNHQKKTDAFQEGGPTADCRRNRQAARCKTACAAFTSVSNRNAARAVPKKGTNTSCSPALLPTSSCAPTQSRSWLRYPKALWGYTTFPCNPRQCRRCPDEPREYCRQTPAERLPP